MSVAISELAPIQAVQSDSLPIVIIGTGPVGIHALQSFIRREPSLPVVLYGNEPWEPYNRVRLSMLLSGEAKFEDITYKLDIPESSPFVQYNNCAIKKIDRRTRVVIDELGRVQPYSKLILAVGSSPHIPNIQGNHLSGVYTFRSMNDAVHLQARTARSRKVIVVGGGLLGIEAARAMQRQNTEVTIVEHSSRLMSRQLDDDASEMLREYLMLLGIQIMLQNSVKEINGEYSVSSVVLRKGTEIKCDTVILATGIKPNIDLAIDAGISVGRGIRVNDQMETSAPDIYAVGECAEHREKIYGLVGPGQEQADVAIHSILKGKSKYTGSIAATNLKVVGKPVFSMGRVGEEEFSTDLNNYVYQDRSEGIYRKVILKRNRIVGAIAIGGWQEQGRIQEGINKQRYIWPWQLMRFIRFGFIWPEQESNSVASWPSGAAVCNCTGVSRGQLSTAIQQGNNTVEKLMACTGASTVCGSCRPLLMELTGNTELSVITRGAKLLTITSISLLLAFFLLLLLGSVPYSESANTVFAWDELWRNNNFKQISGFTILGLSIIALALSLRKRLKRISFGDFALWRVFHVIASVLVVLTILVHSGFRLGDNLNQYLMLTFLAVLVTGSVSALAIGLLHKMDVVLGKKVRESIIWGHVLFFWPIPVLLGFHVFSSYYF